ncbi:MAG TPA: DedA family protein [Bacteroidaceae bacterium]|nr:DedA family protein [Bacteroidaceae bacterium]
MESLPLIQWCLNNLNYWTITLLMTIESTAIPFPSEIVVPPAAYQAASTGAMSIPLIILFATIGACLGALINYYVSLFVGKPLVYKFANSRLGHIMLLDEEKIKKAEAFFYKHGTVSTFIGRLIPVIRQLISIPAGLAKMPIWKFIGYTALGAGIWNVILAMLGYYLEKIIPADKLNDTVAKHSHVISIGIIIILVAVLIFIIHRARKTEKKR